MEQRLTRQARNEAIIREVNERIEQLDKAAEEANVGSQESFFEFLCECGGGNAGDIGCEERIPMTISEYENVRSQNDRFAVNRRRTSNEVLLVQALCGVNEDKRVRPDGDRKVVHDEDTFGPDHKGYVT